MGTFLKKEGAFIMSEAYAFQEETEDEMIDGKIIAMSPRPVINHHEISINIAIIFRSYLKGKTCRAYADGVDLYLTPKDRFIPDGMVVCDKNKIKFDGVHGTPNLVIEILSPSTAKRDRGYKKDIYGKSGVQEYWLVNPADKSVEIYLSNGSELVFNNIYTLYPDYLLEKMTDEERSKVETTFKCSLFDDLEFSLDEIFRDLL